MSALRRLPSLTRPLRLLAIESSADDSCASIVTSDRRILSNVVVKQHLIHGASFCCAKGVPILIRGVRKVWRDTSYQEPGCPCEEYRTSIPLRNFEAYLYFVATSHPDGIKRSKTPSKRHRCIRIHTRSASYHNRSFKKRRLTARATGPGMYGCLSCGSHAAHAMAAMMDKPIVGVHHMVRLPLSPVSHLN
jgi:N6-L-threonylcarbamoyladenine synthase